MTAIELSTENALVSQKNRIIEAINSAQDADELQAAFDLLVFASEVWHATGYGYKVAEIRSRLEVKARWLIDEDEKYLSVLRKNAVTRASTEKNVARLRVIFDKCR